MTRTLGLGGVVLAWVAVGMCGARVERLRAGEVAALAEVSAAVGGRDPAVLASAFPKWPKILPAAGDYFPIGVWLQDPKNAGRYKDLGINLYVGLWKGPTEAQLTALSKAGMPVICAQNEVGLHSANNSIIIGWMHGDEPDNAQSRGAGKGYGPPIAPEAIQERYRAMHEADPSRPVLLNLGQGVAWDGWIGRGVRRNHPEDYARYIGGGDIVSFDIYPAVATDKAVAGQLWRVPFGVMRLRQWSRDRKPVWNCIETTRISNVNIKPTPGQVKAEVWLSIIHGSRGIIYFVHQFKPTFIEAGLLADAEMAGAVKGINRQVAELAVVINSPAVRDRLEVKAPENRIATTVRQHEGASYVFAAGLGSDKVNARFSLKGMEGAATVTVLGEDRSIEATDGVWKDAFEGYGVHLYRVETRGQSD